MSDLPPVTDPSIIDAVREAVPGAVIEPAASMDMPAIVVGREHLVEICRALRDLPSLQFAFLAEVTAVDYLPAEPRFEVIYHLACLGPAFAQPGGAAPARRLRMKVRLAGDDARLPSVTSDLSDRRLARARGLRPLRHRLRRPSRPAPHSDDRRLGGTSAAQGLSGPDSPRDLRMVGAPDDPRRVRGQYSRRRAIARRRTPGTGPKA